MRRRSLKVSFVTDTIAAGGGPPGYTYNLLNSLGRPSSKEQGGLDVRFVGRRRSFRLDGGAKSASGSLAAAQREAGHLMSITRLAPRAAGRARFEGEWRHACATSDIVVFQGYQDPRRMRAAKRSGAQVAYMPHSPVPVGDEYRELTLSPLQCESADRAERELITLSDHVYFPCAEAIQPYIQAYSETDLARKIRYLESGVVVPDTLPLRPARTPQRFRVVYLGRYIGHKGYDLFVEMAERLGPLHRGFDFVTMGSGPLSRASEHVTDMGWNPSPLTSLWEADIVVVPNRVAYFDLLPLEVASVGIGMVMTEVGGNLRQLKTLPDTIGCGVGSLAEGVLQAFHELKNAPAWGSANRQAYLIRYSGEAFAQRWLDDLRDIGTRKGR